MKLEEYLLTIEQFLRDYLKEAHASKPLQSNWKCLIFAKILTAGSAKKEMPRSAKPADSSLPSHVRGVLSP